MSLTPEDDAAAAEYALGTLDAAERAIIAARRLREPLLEAAIRGWEDMLSPLAEAIPSIDPPRDYFAEIEARIKRSPPPPAARDGGGETLAALRSRLARWRAAAVGATAIAAMLAIGFVVREGTGDASPRQFVAVLRKSADAPAFAVTVNLDTREFTVRPVDAPTPADKSYELWIIDPKIGPPRSLGVIDHSEITRAHGLKPYDSSVVEDATYAVTVEPKGGSPDGKPSGAPVFVGKLVPVGP